MANKTSIFHRKELTPKTSYLKVTIYGEQGAGKTYTAARIATGIHLQMKKEGVEAGPVCMVDSETGAAKLYTLFQGAGVPFLPIGTESYDDLVQAVKDAEQMQACALIVDSVTHFSDDLKRAYMRHHKKAFIQVWDYGPLGELWLPWTKLFINSRLNIIACGRLAWDYTTMETQDGDRVKKEVVRDQAKFRSLGKFGYEGDVLLEMELFQNREKIGRENDGPISFRRAYVMKDRWGQIEGKIFDNPGFEDMMLPIWKVLAPIAEHRGVEQRATHGSRFGDSEMVEDRRRARAALQEIDGDLSLFFPGQTEGQKLARSCIPFFVFGTHSRDKIEAMRFAMLDEASKTVNAVCRRIIDDGIELTRARLLEWMPGAVEEARLSIGQPSVSEATDPDDPFLLYDTSPPPTPMPAPTPSPSTPTPAPPPPASPPPAPAPTSTPAPTPTSTSTNEHTYEWLASVVAVHAESNKCKKLFSQIKMRRRLPFGLTLDDLLSRDSPTAEDVAVLEEIAEQLGKPEGNQEGAQRPKSPGP